MATRKNGVTYYLNGNTWFKPSYGANGVYYTVVPALVRSSGQQGACMKIFRRAVRGCFAAAAILVATLTTGPAQAQSAGDDWRFSFILYGWFPSIGGTTSFPTGGSGSFS